MGLFDTIAAPLTGGTSMLFGSNPVTKALGLSGDQGAYWQPGQKPVFDQQQLDNANAATNGSSDNGRSFSNYGTGVSDLNTTLNQLKDNSAGNNTAYTGMLEGLASNPLSGSKLASDQVQSNPLSSGLFGQGGTLDRTNAEEQNLANKGFSLTPEDNEAYGQASGNIARLFGTQEQGLSQSLADRGLAGAPSGVAGAGFSGLQGNKNEMLAQSQMQIAQNRMNMNLQRLGQTRQFLSQLGQQGENDVQDQYNRNLAGVANAQGQRQLGVSNDLNKYNADINNYNAQNGAGLASQQDQRGAQGKTLLQGLGNGLFSSASSIGSAPGSFVNSAAGSAGKAAGSGAGA